VRQAPLPAERVRPLAEQMLRGLGAAHERGVVHRDLKPGNIMVTPAGVVKLVDFGLADAAEESTLTPAGYVVGTPAYMAPEQAIGSRPTPQSDLFSLGVILYELLTGRRPFLRETMAATLAAIVHADPAPFDVSLPESTRCLEPAILRALRKNPEERYSSAEAFLRALEDAGAGPDPPGPA
jgi:serine/threonine-protein kinase